MTNARAFAALADPTRREVFERLSRGPRAVGDLARDLPVSRPAVSQHLRVLTEAGLVDVRPDGNRRLYRWRPEGLRDAADFLEEMWSDRLARLKVAAERHEWPERARAGLARRPPSDEETTS